MKEYKVVNSKIVMVFSQTKYCKKVENLLNEQAKQGWNFVNNIAGNFVFERDKNR